MAEKNLYIVGIGASAGGLDAIQKLFDHFSDDTDLAFVVVQHLSPDFKSLMPELLAKHTNMQIFTAEDKQEILPNCIYLNQRNKNLHVKGNRLYLLDKGPKHNLNLPIDIFFHTLGEEHKERSIGVILSGTGSDGSRGIKTIKEAGGTVIVQDPRSAQFDGMPNSAISTNSVDFVMTPGDIAEILKKFPGERIRLNAGHEDQGNKSNDIVYLQILEEIHKESGIDFRQYKSNTLLRRLEKRMNAHNSVNLYEYLSFMRSHRKEVDILKQDFLIGVTRFFRDTEAFKLIKQKVIPDLVSSRPAEGSPIRIWVAGCSTGEEVYSLAMLFDDYIRKNRLNTEYKIFATDIDGNALIRASEGSYHVNISNEISKEYLEEYFVKQGDRLQIIKRIRDRIVFSKHNLSQDPPFISIDLISCRNLLIYLNNDLQDKVFQDFQFSLNYNGYLFLGSSESLGEQSKFFEEVDSKNKIFRSIVETKQVPSRLRDDVFPNSVTRELGLRESADPQYRYRDNPDTGFYKYLSKRFSPSSVFIDKEYNILFIKGDAGELLQHREGAFKNNLLEMLSPELGTIIRSSIRKVIKTGVDVRINKVTTKKHSRPVSLDLTISKVKVQGQIAEIYLIHFSDETVPVNDVSVIDNVPLDEVSQQRIDDLETELSTTKVELQNVVEELETSNEELQSSNEELMASNEELQSTNEELQSVNEELYTVNSELQEKNQELHDINNDMNNLFESTEIGTLFLDRELKIRKYTKPLTHHFSLTEKDISRSIHGFSSSFGEQVKNAILARSVEALDELKSSEMEVVDSSDRHFLCRISPFITIDKMIDGVVITFIDITELKSKEKALSESHEELALAQEIAQLGSWSFNLENGVILWTDELFKMFGLEPDSTPPSYEAQEGFFSKDSWLRLTQAIEHTRATGEPYEIELDLTTASGEEVWIWARGAVEYDANKRAISLRGVAQNITERVKLRDELVAQKQFLDRVNELSPVGIFVSNYKEDRYQYFNDQFSKILGFTPEEVERLGRRQLLMCVHPDDHEAYQAHLDEVIKGGQQSQYDFKYQRQDGVTIWCRSVKCVFERDRAGNVLSYIGVIADITDEKAAEGKLKEAIKAADTAAIYKDQFLANMSHEIRTPLNGIVGFSEILRDDSLEQEMRHEYLDIIQSCSGQLLRLIDDIINLSQIEAGELKLEVKECKLSNVIESLKTTFDNLKRRKDKAHIEFKETVPPEAKDIIIETDGHRLQQVLINLLSNALKFSDEGVIEFGYRQLGDSIEFFVQDQGIGISEDRMEVIFERFEHLEDMVKNYEGTGLGLSLSLGIVQLLGGSMHVESKLGEGSTFSFRIPYESAHVVTPQSAASAMPAAHVDEKAIKQLKLLVVEDDKMNQAFFATLLNRMDLDFVIASDGKEAVELVRTQGGFDVILMDIRMPVMNGEEAAAEILKLDSNAKIIAQTANAMYEDKAKYLKQGFCDYITKPINAKVLKEKLTQLRPK
ncbi:chemotaxis protein CheB [Coraliomargarita sp. SDUM461003]|uniref:Chemotaxis protein CheB n=1 Tax=Thalassobacterium maritimum TaxID=3041265 RepID=A0ABU1B0Z1_9BACT|nr:chemotaxis protein CheB [Coraliomargarita sp. SDUM461003]MDQ8209017.1 chemotaxis protein CheB [Coraliomargarita sp. SDUM461003]